jgi:hypothetical protein
VVKKKVFTYDPVEKAHKHTSQRHMKMFPTFMMSFGVKEGKLFIEFQFL